MNQPKVGEKVQITGVPTRIHSGTGGTIVKVNRTTVDVKVDDPNSRWEYQGRTLRVPADAVEADARNSAY